VQELAAVAEAAEARLLVVLAHVRREVGHGDGADVRRRLDRSHLPDRRRRVLRDEGLVVSRAAVRPGAGTVDGGGGGTTGVAAAAEETFRAHGVVPVFVEPVGLLGGVVGHGDVGGAVGGEFGGLEVGASGVFRTF